MRRLACTAVLSAAALTAYVLEAQLPLPLPVPGLKLGLANLFILFTLDVLGRKPAFGVLLVKIFLGNFLTGQAMSLLYSLAGGLLSFWVMASAEKLLQENQLWVAGVMGSVVHILGQMAVALAVTRTPALLYYLAVLLLCGIVTGTLTGAAAQLLRNKKKIFRRILP